MNKTLTEVIKTKAKKAGVDLIGFIPVEEADKYSGLEVPWKGLSFKKTTDCLENAKSLIVLGYGKRDDMMDVTVREDGKWRYPGEMLQSVRQRDLALFLKDKGINVYARYPLISHKHLALLAGFGKLGKHSMVNTKEYGPEVRFRCIITDVELDYDVYDISYSSIKDERCDSCNRCIEKCPGGAINDYKINPEKCIIGRYLQDKSVEQEILDKYQPHITQNGILMCRVCQAVCPK